MGRIVEHTMRRGETLYSLAQYYGVPLERVYELNPWARGQIREGDKVLFPTGEAYKKSTNRTHEVAPGETIYRICRTYGISEETLLAANPHISRENFKSGTVLTIPSGYAIPDSTERPRLATQTQDTTDSSSEVHRPIRILLMLPMTTTARNLEFYEGFLMGVNDLKKDGISMHLKVVDTPTDESVSQAILSGLLHEREIIIGGVNPNQMSMISAHTPSQATYIIPFNSNEGDWSGIQINQPQRNILGRVAEAFRDKYTGLDLVLVSSNDTTVEDELVDRLRQLWSESGYRVRRVNLDDRAAEVAAPNSVLLPVSGHRQLAQKLFARLAGRSTGVHVFGYPQWQTYGADFARQAHQYGATIYSPFFFDPEHRESKHFLLKYRAWYNKKISNTYPKYSVLGYDLARYFIRSYAHYGKDYLNAGAMLSSDGLQMDIALEHNPQTGGYVNSKFYFVTYQTDGTISRTSLP